MIEKLMDWIEAPTILMLWIIMTGTLIFFFGGLGYGVWYFALRSNDPSEKTIVLHEKNWVCTHPYQYWNSPRAGMLTRFGRTIDSPGYYSNECAQWSAKMVDGTIAKTTTP